MSVCDCVYKLGFAGAAGKPGLSVGVLGITLSCVLPGRVCVEGGVQQGEELFRGVGFGEEVVDADTCGFVDVLVGVEAACSDDGEVGVQAAEGNVRVGPSIMGIIMSVRTRSISSRCSA